MKRDQKVAKLAKKDKKRIEGAQQAKDSNEDDEYDDQMASDDNNFIASDNEVQREQEEAARREKRRLKRERREERKKKRLQGAKGEDSDPEDVIDEEDLELINENKSRPRKLKKTGGGHAVDSDLEDDEQIDSSAIVKREEFDRRRLVKKQIFEKRGESTAADEDQQAQMNQVQSLKDKFVTEDIDDLFGTPHDLEIVEKDIPERLQIKIGDRLSPTEQEIEREAEWIFNIIIDSLTITGDQHFAQKISETKLKICKVLKLFRCENCDVPYITRYRQNELIPELQPEDVWRIFNLDIEYGKFQIQKKQCDDFFQKLSEFGNPNQMDHYKNQIFYTKNQRDLNDFVPLMNFYKSYYSKELSLVMVNTGKKLPVQKKEFVFNARQRRLDEFSRRCMLNPVQLVENIQEDKQLHKPNQPQTLGPTDMAKEYILASESTGKEGLTTSGSSEPLEIIKDMCVYTATELQCQPDIRRGFKKHIRDFGIIHTEPTEKGLKELDVFHPSYRVKRVSKKLKELAGSDLFLDILQNESLGLIKYQIQIQDENEDERIGNKYFQNMFEKFKYPEDSTKWRFLRREIFEIFSAQNTQTNKGQKSFLMSILDEIKIELKEDAENHVTKSCSQKYRDFMETGYFKIQNEQRQFNQKEGKRARAIEEDLIPQRERLNVMGAIIYPLDGRNFQTTVAVVDQYGELTAHKDFLYVIPPRKPRLGPDGAPPEPRPGEEEGARRHAEDRREFQEILREHKVDLIVVSADCHEAKRLKKALSEFANLKITQDQMQENDDDENQNMANDDESNSKEAFVIWGRPEIPKLFATSHYSQKLLKNHPFVLKKAICLARFEQDPLNEILNLWSPIMSENQALHLNLHPLQKHINQARLIDHLEQINTEFVNRVGVDINLLVDHEHWHNQLQFLSGLGPRKAQRYIQKLKSLGKPLYTRNEIYENKILKKNCFVSSLGFTKVRVPPEKRPDDMQTNILDQTRIHLRNYDHVYKLVTDCLYENQPDIEQYKQQQAVNQIIKNPEKLKEFAMGEYKEQIKQVDKVGIGFIFDQIIEDLMHPFMDFREDKQIIRTPNEQRFSSRDLFYSLIDETERTFRAGMIVSATVLRIYDSNGSLPARILCKLENGLDASIGEQDADFFPGAQDGNSVDQGSIVTGRVDTIKFGDKFANDENYTIILKCKQSHLRRHDLYLEKLDLGDLPVPEEDKINMNFKVQEEQAQNQQKSLIQKRKIQHQRFQNVSSTTAISSLSKEDNGEFYFRPSSRGTDHITLTWKFHETNIVHIDITEYEKAIGANIGSKLRISDETYENLQEIVERYITPCNRSLREVTQHPKFLRCQNLDELQKSLEQEKEEDASRIPYKFTVLDKYPQYVVLAYVPKKELVKEFIKVKPRGYFFHHQYHYPFQNMINWFKQEFRSREYQRYLRKTGSPQLLAGQASNPSNQAMATSTNTGMQIDSGAGADGNWGSTEPVKNEAARASPEGPGWGAEQSHSVKDEREKAGGWTGQSNGAEAQTGWAGGAGWGNGAGGGESHEVQSPPRSERSAGRGRGRGGGGAGGSRACFKCAEEGHMSRECPTGGGGGGGNRACYGCGQEGHISRDCPDGGGSKSRGPMTCYNCQGEGHMSRECQEPRKERNDGERPPYKRQKRDDGDGGGGFGGNDNPSSWKQPSDGGGWGGNAAATAGGGWSANPSATPGGGGWDAAGGSQNPASQGSGGWGQAATPGPTGAPASQGSDGGWGNKDATASQNNGGGWN